MRFLKTVFILVSVILLHSCGDVQCPKCKGSGLITEEYTDSEEYKVPVKRVVKEDCNNCRGKGHIYYTYKKTVKKKFGLGTIYECRNGRLGVAQNTNPEGGQYAGRTCPECNGRGELQCGVCDGYGYKKVMRKNI